MFVDLQRMTAAESERQFFSRAVNCSAHGVTIQREFRQNVERCISTKNAFIAEAASKIQNAAE